MPHLVLEYSKNCIVEGDFKALFNKFHDILQNTGGINRNNCKSRVIPLDNYFIADGADHHSFVHLAIKFMEGRTLTTRQAIGEQCLSLLQDFFSQSVNHQSIQITVEVGEIALDSYHKYPKGSLTKQ